MRAVSMFSLFVAVCFLPVFALADPIDHLSITGNGQDFEFNLPASTTGPDFGQSFSFGQVSGTLNNSPVPIDLAIIFPGPCGPCDLLQLTAGTQTQFFYLPSLYQVVVNQGDTETLNLLLGSYPAYPQSPVSNATYTIDIAAQTPLASTPEPGSLCLVGTVALFSLATFRRRLVPNVYP